MKHLSFANYVFDVSVHDIFTILSCGATLCLVSSERMLSDLAGVINEMGVTQTFLTPVARLISPEDVPRLETLLCSGEAITADIIRVWAAKMTLIKLYGPTECTFNATVGIMRSDQESNSRQVGSYCTQMLGAVHSKIPTVQTSVNKIGHRLKVQR